MKKGILFTSLALLSSITLAGCSCSNNGTYSFAYIEFGEDGQHKQSNCSNPTGAEEINYCNIIKEKKLDTYTFTVNSGELTYATSADESITGTLYYKVKDNEFMFSTEKKGEYKKYSNENGLKFLTGDKSIEIYNDYYTVVYKK